MGKIRNDQNGLTLVELIVAISITTMVLVGIATFLVKSINNNYAGQAKADLLKDAQLSLDAITKDIRLSAGVDDINYISDPNSPDAEATLGHGWESNANTLILLKSAENTDRQILFADPNRYITAKNNIIYFVKDRTLYKRTIAADIENNRSTTSCPAEATEPSCPKDIRLIEDVDGFNLKYYDVSNNEVDPEEARSVESTLVVSKVKGGRRIHAEYSTRTVFRNE